MSDIHSTLDLLDKSAGLAQWAGVLAQLVSSLALVVIAYFTYSYSKKSVRATVNHYMRQLLNDWNREVIRTPETIYVASKLRDPIIGQPDDQMVFIYLNYLNARWKNFQEGLAAKPSWLKARANSTMWLYRLDRDNLVKYLDSGYEEAFKFEILEEYDCLRAKETIVAHPSHEAI